MIKSTTQDIASTLVDKHSLTPVAAGKFVDEFFKLISDTLSAGKIVKVKGLGTFKIVEVQDRESVNVNTGERVVIEGHGKVSFTPDNSLKDIVNKPFAQFETVIVNDNVDFSDFDNNSDDGDILGQIDENIFSAEEKENANIIGDSASKDEKTDKVEQSSEEIQKAQLKVDAKEKPLEHHVVIDKETVADKKNIIGKDSNVDKETVTDKGNITDKENIINKDSNVDKESTVDKESIVDKETVRDNDVIVDKELVINEKSADEEKPAVDEKPAYGEELADDESHHVGKYVLCFIGAFILLVGGFLSGQFLSSKGIYDVFSSVKESSLVATSKKMQTVQHERVAIKESDKTAMNEDTAVKENEKATKSVQPTASQYEAYNNKSIKVKTGAYRIIGIEKVITLNTSESLKSIASRTLGPGMECYLSVFNDIDEGQTINPGQKIKIPKLELRRHKAH